MSRGRSHDWREIYSGARPEDLPWFSPSPDSDFLEALNHFASKPGRALDVGCGPGTHSVALAHLGWQVTALDIAPGAISMARKSAAATGVSVRFVNQDALDFKPVLGSFDLVHDRGFLHGLPAGSWRKWNKLAGSALKVGGLVIAKEFIVDPMRAFGPRGLTESEIRGVLSRGFRVEQIDLTRFSDRDEAGSAMLVVARRT